MKVFSKAKIIIQTIIPIISLIFCCSIVIAKNPYLFKPKQNNQFESFWEGTGCMDDPFLINNVSDLITLRECVGEGISFEGYYFKQTCNLDLGSDNVWIPIGEYGSGNYFYGTYDGNANYISNLNYKSHKGTDNGNGALFGTLGGQVLNLGIESGHIEGAYVGSIASHSIGSAASIINCYNKASIIGTGRAGGICDNFTGGSVVNCVNYGDVFAPQSAQIVSYNAGSLVNVYPSEDAVSATFQGIFVNYVSSDQKSAVEFLNEGIQYLNTMQLLPAVELKLWNE
ncbi:MAG: hypothetical protein NC489_44410 [Ruminococcus flavefaciens]|nr:hypothetical protein [Ruminococcus flavefaciens]